jgi:hypothetical protein
MYVARSFLEQQGLIRRHFSKFGTVGRLDLQPLESMECVAVRREVLDKVIDPRSWIETRLQVLRAYFEAQLERDRGHTAPGLRRACMGVREFKGLLRVVPNWRYLGPVLHNPAPAAWLFPGFQAEMLEKACTTPDSGKKEIAPKEALPVYHAGHRSYHGRQNTMQYPELGAGQARRKDYTMPRAVIQHIR